MIDVNNIHVRILICTPADSSVQSSLSKHLIRTLGQELVDMLIVYSAYKEGRKPFISALDQESDSRLNIELQDVQRDELINGMNADDRANASKARAIAIAGKVTRLYGCRVKT
jgi:DNA-binding transcriptional ArsR family regulator